MSWPLLNQSVYNHLAMAMALARRAVGNADVCHRVSLLYKVKISTSECDGGDGIYLPAPHLRASGLG